MAGKQFKLSIENGLLEELNQCAEEYGRSSAQQVVVEVLTEYLPFWKAAAESHRQFIDGQKERALGKQKIQSNKVGTGMMKVDDVENPRPKLRHGQSAGDVSRDIYAKTGVLVEAMLIIDYINGYKLEEISDKTQKLISASIEGRLKQVKDNQSG